MLSKLRPRSVYDVLAAIAFFAVVAGGSAYAAATIGSSQIKKNAILSKHIKNGQVKNSDLAANSVTSGKIKDGQVNGTELAPNSVDSGKVAPDSLTGANIDESTLGAVPSADNASKLGGVAAAHFPQNFATGPHANAFNVYSYFVDTSTNGTKLPVGQVQVETNGTPGVVLLCGDTESLDPMPYVAYLNGARSTGTIAGVACAPPFNVGAGGDFEFRVRRADIVGVHSGDSTTSKNYEVLAFTSL